MPFEPILAEGVTDQDLIDAGIPGSIVDIDGVDYIQVDDDATNEQYGAAVSLAGQSALSSELSSSISSALAGLTAKTFEGVATAGEINLTGVTVGQTVAAIWILDGSIEDVTDDFESTISRADQLQQTANVDYSSKKFAVLLS